MLKTARSPPQLSKAKFRGGLEGDLTKSASRVAGILNQNKTSSQKKLDTGQFHAKSFISKQGSKSTKVLPSSDLAGENSKQEKLLIAIEKKFEGSTMKRYRFPNCEPNEPATPEDSLCSLKEVQVYDLHSQNKKPSLQLQTSPTLTSSKTKRAAKANLNLHTEYTNLKFTKAFKDSNRMRPSALGQSTDKLNSLLKKLGVHKDQLRDISNSKGKTLPREVSIGSSTIKRTFGEDLKSSKHAILLKYLKASRAKIENFKQRYLPDITQPSLLDLKSSLLRKPSPNRERNSANSGNSFGNLFRSRQETSAEKFKSLKLSCLGPMSQSPETKIKNSKSFLFSDSTRLVSKTKEMSAEAYNLPRKIGLDKPQFDIGLSGHSEHPIAVTGLASQKSFSRDTSNQGWPAPLRSERLHYRSLIH